MAAGDPTAYQTSQDIRVHLAAADPANTQRQRELAGAKISGLNG